MTESHHSDAHHARAAQHALDHLADPESGAAPDALAASYVDVMGLLPFADSPVVPAPSIKASLLEAIADGPDAEHAATVAPGTGTPAAATPAAATLAPVVEGSFITNRLVSLALAAMLGLCVVGLAILGRQVRTQDAQLAQLAARIEVADSVVERQAGYVSTLLQASDRHLEMITTIARQAYPMRGVVAAADRQNVGEPSPRGVVWVCGQHQRWYLNVQGLAEPPPGQRYVMWFVTDGGMVNAGRLDVDAASLAELEAQFMPVGTHSFQVTLESAAQDRVASPRGVPILVADKSVRL